MYINLNSLVHKLAADLFEQTFQTSVSDNPTEELESMVKVLALFCEIDLLMSDFPSSWVEIQGDENYVKHSLLDIS